MGYATKLKQHYTQMATLPSHEASKQRDKRNRAGIHYAPPASQSTLSCRGKEKRKGVSMPPRGW